MQLHPLWDEVPPALRHPQLSSALWRFVHLTCRQRLNPYRLANLVCGLLPPHAVLRPTPLARGSLGSSIHWCTNLRAA